MTLAIMQPYFLPYIGYLQLMNTVDTFVFYDDVAFINRGWINRNRILVNGKDFLFTIPLKDASQNRRICEIELSSDAKWRSKLLKTMEQSYRKAPYYAAVFPVLEKIVNQEAPNIAAYIQEGFVTLNQFLGINTKIIPTSTVYGNDHLKAQERILDICKQEKANRYINPIGGMELYDKSLFADSGIDLFFLQSKRVTYQQAGASEFIPWLSIIDILMHNDVPAIRKMLDEFELV
ncbi:WbqC family protein [Tellurirhabdus bombi]|uniref:WbqC family protein n=1 Tax=Tellurirhabdus bombi TaxID=2907205 RepID=UPI001F486282|nr:WbqC family protein [Tellurirhabdus bombi]